MVRVLFVCLGNICRSPTAEGVFRTLVEREGLAHVIQTDSAGTHGYHVGDSPDRRTIQAAAQRGVDLSRMRARKATSQDFHDFDYVIAMDDDNARHLGGLQPVDARARLELFLHFAPDRPEREVPDPYYGGGDGFENVLDMVEAASRGLLTDIRSHHPDVT